MLKKIHPWFFLFFSIVFFACKKVDIQFGDQFLDNGYTQVIKVDSFGMDVSTIYIDSFITSAKGVGLVGAYNDPDFGRIAVTNFFEVTPPTYVDAFAATTFDSLELILRLNRSYYGDSTKPLHIEVNRLSQPIVGYDDNLLNLYNTQNFSVQSIPIGSKNVVIRPYLTDSISIRLDDNLGKDLLKKLQNPSDPDLQTSAAFLQYFNGLRVSSGSAVNSMIIGCKDSVVVRLHYKKPDLYLQTKQVDFTLANTSHHFNNINVDRSATPLKSLSVVKQINSIAMGNTAYTMYAAGTMVKIRFPTIRDILKLPNFAKILKATLIVRPVRGSYGLNYSLPPQLRLSGTTQLNQIGSDLSAISTTGSSIVQTGGLVIDYLYGENTNYAYDLTNYIKSIITDASINGNGLLLIPQTPALETQFNRLIIGNNNNSAGKMELLIVYAAVQ